MMYTTAAGQNGSYLATTSNQPHTVDYITSPSMYLVLLDQQTQGAPVGVSSALCEPAVHPPPPSPTH
jgi:hypothetical protein